MQRPRKTTKHESPVDNRADSLTNVYLQTVLLDTVVTCLLGSAVAVVALAWLVTPKLTQRGGKLRVHRSKHIIRGDIRHTIMSEHCFILYVQRKCYFWL